MINDPIFHIDDDELSNTSNGAGRDDGVSGVSGVQTEDDDDEPAEKRGWKRERSASSNKVGLNSGVTLTHTCPYYLDQRPQIEEEKILTCLLCFTNMLGFERCDGMTLFKLLSDILLFQFGVREQLGQFQLLENVVAKLVNSCKKVKNHRGTVQNNSLPSKCSNFICVPNFRNPIHDIVL